MNCKKCGAQLPEDVTLCPDCGEENIVDEVTVQAESPEQEAPAVQKKAKVSPLAVALSVAAIVVLAAVFIGLIIGGLNPGKDEEPTIPTAGSLNAGEETVPATHPADTGLDDETCKGSYSADDETVAAARETVVARLGDAELTNGQLQVYYWMEVSGFYSQYYYYASMLGIDFAQPLDSQLCPLFEETVTWQQYFLGCAINNWLNYQGLVLEAESKGFQLSDLTSLRLEAFPENFAQEAKDAGYENVDLYLYDNLGAGAAMDDYLAFMRLVYTGGEYYDKLCADMTFTDEEVDAYFTEHEAEYAANGLDKTTCTVNVRHILVFPEGATGETIRTQTFPEEAWEVGRLQAEEILAKWEEGDKTEESFAEFAKEYSADPGSKSNGGLYTGVAKGQMVASFEDWCFDETREVGHYGIVRTELGFHIMYFSGRDYLWDDTVREDMIRDTTSELLTEMVEKFERSVDYKSILIGNAGIFQGVG